VSGAAASVKPRDEQEAGFSLDSRLARDTVRVTDLALCRVLLMNDARFPWLILVPRRAGAVEILDLSPMDQVRLWAEIRESAEALCAAANPLKLNIGALGNIVRQLHIHIVARNEGDAAWPGPVWGSGAAVAYAPEALQARLDSLEYNFD
jgi:diadenosine tetraphosphate (Ap4A) HIT family hydrolase